MGLNRRKRVTVCVFASHSQKETTWEIPTCCSSCECIFLFKHVTVILYIRTRDKCTKCLYIWMHTCWAEPEYSTIWIYVLEEVSNLSKCTHPGIMDSMCICALDSYVCMCICVCVCLLLLLWVSNASWMWYLWVAIFEWCLLTVMACSQASDTGGDQTKACVCVCVCVFNTETLFSMIQTADCQTGGPKVILNSQRVSVNVSVWVCVRLWFSYRLHSWKPPTFQS